MSKKRIETIFSNVLITCVIGIHIVFLLRINLELFDFLPLSLLFRIFSIVGMISVCVLLVLNRLYLTKDIQLLMGFYAVLLLSTLLNRHTFSSMSITMLVTTFDYFFIFYFAGKYFTDKLKSFIVNSTLIVIFLLSIISLYLFFSGDTIVFPNGYSTQQIAWPDSNRLHNIFVQPNQAAILSIIAFLLSLYLSRIHTKMKYVFYLIAIIELLVLSLTQSRTNYLLLILLGTIYLFRSPFGSKYKKVLPVLFALGIALAIIILVTVRPVQSQQATLYGFLNKLSSNRLMLWRDAIRLTTGWHILLGNGIHAYSQIRTETLGEVFGYFFDNTHNLFIDTYFASGIIGVLILLIIIWYITKTIRNKSTKSTTPWVQLCAYLCLTIFLFAQLDCAILFISKSYNLLFWFMLGSLTYHPRSPRSSKSRG